MPIYIVLTCVISATATTITATSTDEMDKFLHVGEIMFGTVLSVFVLR
jgi:hypothetical protein